MAAETKIDTIINLASRRQQRRNPEVLEFVKAGIQSYLKEGPFAAFPFWFLRIEPGYKFELANMPMTQDDLENATPVSIPGHPSVDYWLDRGLLRTEAGVNTYQLFAPAASPEGDIDGAYWVPTGYQKSLYLKPVSLKGSEGPEIDVVTPQAVLNHGFSYKQCHPCLAHVEKSRTGAYLHLSPTPDKSYLFKYGWVTDIALNYYLDEDDVVDENWTNRAMQEYEELYIAVAHLKIAEYFGDLPNIEFYRNKLATEVMPNLKMTHRIRKRQQVAQIATWKSNPMKSGSIRKTDPWGRQAGGRRW